MEMHLRIAATQFRDVRLEPRLVEPAVHLIVLFTQNASNHRQGKLLKLDRLAQDTTEDCSRLGIRQFASCDLQRLTNELVGAIKRQGYKGTNIIDGDGLIWLVGPDGIRKLALQDADFSLFEVVILHKGCWPD